VWHLNVLLMKWLLYFDIINILKRITIISKHFENCQQFFCFVEMILHT